MFWPNLKFVALPVPEIIGGTKKLDSPCLLPRSLFSLPEAMCMHIVGLYSYTEGHVIDYWHNTAVSPSVCLIYLFVRV